MNFGVEFLSLKSILLFPPVNKYLELKVRTLVLSGIVYILFYEPNYDYKVSFPFTKSKIYLLMNFLFNNLSYYFIVRKKSD